MKIEDLEFRAWDGKDMYYFNINEIDCGAIEVLDTSPKSDNNSYAKLIDLQIMRYVGQVDVFKQKIYEGDIIKVNTILDIHPMCEQEIICEVVWNNKIATYDLNTIESDLYLKHWGFYDFEESNPLRIIGNIYEKPNPLNYTR